MMRSPRNRVHDMIRSIRSERQTRNVSEPFSDARRSEPTPARFIQNGGGRDSVNAKNTDTEYPLEKHTDSFNIFVMVVLVVLFTIVCVCAGQWVDNELNQYQKRHASTSSPVALIAIQMLFNVAMLCVPYCVARTFYPDSLVCHYYLVVAAFWVVSLHAQTHLKERFQALFPPADAGRSKEVSKQISDNAIIESLVQDAMTTQKKQNAHPPPTNVVYPPYHAPERNIQLSTRQGAHHGPQDKLRDQGQGVYQPMSNEHFETPVRFNSQDLLPTSPVSHTRATNIADLF